jgi:hypothetical protein
MLVLRIFVLAFSRKEFVLYTAYFTKELSQRLALTPVGQILCCKDRAFWNEIVQ